MEGKVVRDAIHGNIKVDPDFLKLLDNPAVQRLHGIKQLGFAYLVYGGANHTRLEHSLGTSHIAAKMANAMGFSKENKETVRAAALLHDIGHQPYSHTLEHIVQTSIGTDHMDATKEIILGKRNIASDASGLFEYAPINEILEAQGIDAGEVAELVTGGSSSPYTTIEEFGSGKRLPELKGDPALGQIIHSAVDADQIDYLLRDAYYTGVAYGFIDMERLLQTIRVKNGNMAFDRKGVSAIESIIVARGLMYSSVYFHKTARIAESMLCRAVERIPNDKMFDFSAMVDSELIEKLKTVGKYQNDVVMRLKYRKLFKPSLSIPLAELAEERRRILAGMNETKMRTAVEDELARRVGAPEGYVMIDTPGKEILLTEPRIHSTDVRIVDDDKVMRLNECTPIARAIRERNVVDWGVMVSAPEKFREKVGKAAEKVLFD
ncbi:MAG: metal-dependent phosphohydrolase [Thermoplasmata archaeon HGW-Thermoplasmata-2]|nr:MAG: metal-dependent phosphohydrolase [Thermoplasmata archaeon HGW-Thermoplasmata-2]